MGANPQPGNVRRTDISALSGRQMAEKITNVRAPATTQITIRLRQTVIARPAAPLRNQAGRAAVFQTGQQPKDLAPLQTE